MRAVCGANLRPRTFFGELSKRRRALGAEFLNYNARCHFFLLLADVVGRETRFRESEKRVFSIKFSVYIYEDSGATNGVCVLVASFGEQIYARCRFFWGESPDFCWGNKSPDVGTGSASRNLLRQFNLLCKTGQTGCDIGAGET